MTHNKTIDTYEQIQGLEEQFCDLLHTYAPKPEEGDYLGFEYRANLDGNPISEARMVSVQEQGEPFQYIDVGIKVGNETTLPMRVSLDLKSKDENFALYFGEVKLPEDLSAVKQVLGWLQDLAKHRALKRVALSDDEVIDVKIPPYFYH